MCRTMVQTKFNETRFITSDTSEVMGMFLADHLLHEWTEDVADQDSGEVISIKRCEVLMPRGTQITHETAMTINFHIQAGDVTEFEVTDQCRVGFYNKGDYPAPWIVTAHVKGKNRKFILYARGLEEAIEIAADFIEQKLPGHFQFVSVKGYNDCIAITDNFNRSGFEADHEMLEDDGGIIEDEAKANGKCYLLELHIEPKDGVEHNQVFLVFTDDAEKAKDLANGWLAKRARDNYDEALAKGVKDPERFLSFTTTINTATVVNCYCVIPPDFSREYFNHDKPDGEN